MKGPSFFVALVVDAGPWLEEVRATAPASVRVFAPGDLHATVAFLGDVDRDAAQRAFAVARAAAPNIRPFLASLGRVVPMGPEERWSALSAELEAGRDAATALIASLRDAACRAAGAPVDPRPPLPHVTLARLPRKAQPEEREAARAWALGLELGHPEIMVREIALYTRAEDRTRQLFERVEQAPLGKPD